MISQDEVYVWLQRRGTGSAQGLALTVLVTLGASACVVRERLPECVVASSAGTGSGSAGLAKSVAHDSVRLAPPFRAVRFWARVGPDPDHTHPVVNHVPGALVRIDAERHVTAGDTVAIVQEGSGGPQSALVAADDGTWAPGLRPNQAVGRDVVGTVQEHGRWLAVGTTGGADAGVIRVGDLGFVELNAQLRLRQGGSVAWVRRRIVGVSDSIVVAMRIESQVLRTGRRVRVGVTPTGLAAAGTESSADKPPRHTRGICP